MGKTTKTKQIQKRAPPLKKITYSQSFAFDAQGTHKAVRIGKTPAISILGVPYRFTGKERDSETNLYYFGVRYLDAKTCRWLSTDPAMGEYVPAPGQGARLSGLGGVYNSLNLHAYHYAFNNPVQYVDPDGRSGDEVRHPVFDPLRDGNHESFFTETWADKWAPKK